MGSARSLATASPHISRTSTHMGTGNRCARPTQRPMATSTILEMLAFSRSTKGGQGGRTAPLCSSNTCHYGASSACGLVGEKVREAVVSVSTLQPSRCGMHTTYALSRPFTLATLWSLDCTIAYHESAWADTLPRERAVHDIFFFCFF